MIWTQYEFIGGLKSEHLHVKPGKLRSEIGDGKRKSISISPDGLLSPHYTRQVKHLKYPNMQYVEFQRLILGSCEVFTLTRV